MLEPGDGDRAARARDRSRACRRAQLARARRCSRSAGSTRPSPRSARRSGSIPTTARRTRALARAYWVGKGDFAAAIPVFERAIALNPDAGYSYLQLSLLLAWEGQLARAEECQPPRGRAAGAVHFRQRSGCRWSGAHARLGYVYYLQGSYDDALREYERELAFIGASDHALEIARCSSSTSRSAPRIFVRAATEDAARHFGRALEDLRRPRRQWRRRSVHALLHRLPLRAARRHRSRARLARAGRAGPAGAHRRPCARIDIDLESLRTNRASSAIAAPAIARAALRTSRGPQCKTYDVIIVGAGPAGLSAALILGRCRRSVLVCDTGRPRNAASHAMHGFLTRDGMPPREFLRIGRARAREQYDTVELRDRGSGRRVPATADASTSRWRTATVVVSRKLLIATGVVDNLPEIEGFRELYGRSVFHCPVLRRLGSARSAARHLRPRRARARAVARADRLEPRSRALHRRSVRDRRRRRARLERNGIAHPRGARRRLEGQRRRSGAHASSQTGAPLPRRALFFTTGQIQQSRARHRSSAAR